MEEGFVGMDARAVHARLLGAVQNALLLHPTRIAMTAGRNAGPGRCGLGTGEAAASRKHCGNGNAMIPEGLFPAGRNQHDPKKQCHHFSHNFAVFAQIGAVAVKDIQPWLIISERHRAVPLSFESWEKEILPAEGVGEAGLAPTSTSLCSSARSRRTRPE